MDKTVNVRNTGKKYPNFSVNIPTDIAKKFQLRNRQKLFIYHRFQPIPCILLILENKDRPSILRELKQLDEFVPKTGKIRKFKQKKIKSDNIIKFEANINANKESLNLMKKNMPYILEKKINLLIQDELDVQDNAKNYIISQEKLLKDMRAKKSSS